jgi:H+-transporting ATPase
MAGGLGPWRTAGHPWASFFSRLQTLVLLTLVFTGPGNVYLVRERDRLWHSLPSRWLILSSAADIVVAV